MQPLMQPLISLAIIRSAHPAWPQARSLLAAHAQLRIVADVEGLPSPGLLTKCRPDVILAAADLGDYPPLDLMVALQAGSPDSLLLLLGSVTDLDSATLLTLQERGLRGYLLWEEVHPATISHVILAVYGANLLVSSPAVASMFRFALERRCRPRVNGLILTPMERAGRTSPTTALPVMLTDKEQRVLGRLVHGQTQKQIAAAEGISVRTVEKDIATLKDKFAVPTITMLGVMAERWGLVAP